MENEGGKCLQKKPLKKKPKITPQFLNPFTASNPFKGNRKQLCKHLPMRDHDPASVKRDNRSYMAAKYTDFCTLVKGGKIFISSSELEAFVPPTAECCFESSWVAVYGIHSLCMVTFRKPLDLSNPSPSALICLTPAIETKNMEFFSEAVISQVECIPYKGFGCIDEILRGKVVKTRFKKDVVKPFAVVSLVLDTEKSWDEAKDPVSNFLYQRMRNSGLAFNDNETMQTAIGAFQHMCRGQELCAKDILVASCDVSTGRIDHLDIDRITEQLDIVNGNLSTTKSSLP